MVGWVYRKKRNSIRISIRAKWNIKRKYGLSEDQISLKKYKKLYNRWGKVLNFSMIILEWYMGLNKNQFMEKSSKY